MIKLRGKYIFGIISSVGGESALAGADYPGIHTVTRGNFSAVVADSDIVDYKNMERKCLTELLRKHQEVIESLMGNGCVVIPMKLGTFVVDEEEVGSVLEKSASLLSDIMGKVNGKIEIDIVATWNDFSAILKSVSMEKEIQEFKEKLLAGSATITAEDQQKAGLMVMQGLVRKREEYSRRIQDVLIPASTGIKVNDVTDEQMVLNSAFLINKCGQEVFDAEVEKINAELDGELNFKYVGPLPCYSFYTIEVDKIRFESVDLARVKLGLGSSATRDEIKSAYKMKASAVHPDKNPGISGIEMEFDETNKAYKMLMDYCAASDLSFKNTQYCFLEKDVNKNSLLVKVR